MVAYGSLYWFHKVRTNLETAGIEAVVPVPLLSSNRCLVMSFAEGFKINDIEALSAYSVDRTSLMVRSPPARGLCVLCVPS